MGEICLVVSSKYITEIIDPPVIDCPFKAGLGLSRSFPKLAALLAAVSPHRLHAKSVLRHGPLRLQTLDSLLSISLPSLAVSSPMQTYRDHQKRLMFHAS